MTYVSNKKVYYKGEAIGEVSEDKYGYSAEAYIGGSGYACIDTLEEAQLDVVELHLEYIDSAKEDFEDSLQSWLETEPSRKERLTMIKLLKGYKQ